MNSTQRIDRVIQDSLSTATSYLVLSPMEVLLFVEIPFVLCG